MNEQTFVRSGKLASYFGDQIFSRNLLTTENEEPTSFVLTKPEWIFFYKRSLIKEYSSLDWGIGA